MYYALRANYAVSFPEIKEGRYYRSPRRYRKARRAIPPDHLLGDISNDAYMDSGLPAALENLRIIGQRVLVVIMLRDHVRRARSMLLFDESRGRALRPGGRRAMGRRVIERCLTPERLEGVFRTGADVAVLDFDVVTADPAGALNALASLCGIAPYDRPLRPTRINESVRARNGVLAATAVLAAETLRAAGFRKALQFLKDSDRIHSLFFRTVPDGEGPNWGPVISQEHLDVLHSAHKGCWDVVRRRTDVRANGLYVGAKASGL